MLAQVLARLGVLHLHATQKLNDSISALDTLAEFTRAPKDVIAGRDPQLERAVEEAMKALNAKPVDRLMKEPPPPTWGARKPSGR